MRPDMTQDERHRVGFKADAHLVLVIERPIEGTQVRIDSPERLRRGRLTA